MVKLAVACEGARPLAMGGAFTGLADDANNTYWNPAAMGLMDEIEVTYTGTAYDRDVINYDDWLSLVVPLDNLSEGAFDRGVLGLSFMHNTDRTSYSDVYYTLNYSVDAEVKHHWYTLSYGRELKELLEGLCIGANLRYNTLEYDINAALTVGGTTFAANSSSSDNWVSVDLALYYLWEDLSMGILFQDVNQPEYTLFGTEYQYNVNIRPGIAYRWNDRYILSAEIYDLADKSDSRNLRLGVEAKATDNISVRLGGYDITATEKTGRAITGGLGFNLEELFEKVKADISYGLMYWYESEADTEDKFTHFASFTTKF